MAMSGGNGGSLLAEINVTPMVDVMLVLLVIFMVTAPLLEQGVDVDLPRAEAQAVDAEQKKLVLSIDGQRRLYLGRAFVPFSQLFDKLKHNEKLQVERELYLRADRHLPYGLVVRIMALARQAGIEKVGMITEAAPEGELGAESEAGLAMPPARAAAGARP
ncbi:MAG: ExbD/TolR family protein [Proteobacteria bacterium]|nr:ExbD/TolR family protein [Pseudomonadota bacterium]